MNIRFLDEAKREFLDAIAFYEGASRGLGRQFKDEVNQTVLRMAERPELYRLRNGLYRRANLRMFPYNIPFIDREKTLWVLAIAHASRRPLYWISRRDGLDP